MININYLINIFLFSYIFFFNLIIKRSFIFLLLFHNILY